MKVNVQLLALSLFWWVPVYLDLDTGLTYNVATQTAEIEKLKNRRRLPLYSEAPIYQRYLELARDKAGIDFGDFFNRYPHFEFIPDQKPEHAKEFFQEAHVLCDSFDAPSLPDFDEYLHQFKLEFAKDWCKKEGYEWYEDGTVLIG